MIKYKIGDITNAEENIICHQVNCQGKMNSGVAKAIREKWPVVYAAYINCYETLPQTMLLGESQLVRVEEDKDVVNMFAQDDYGYDGKRYTSYDAVWRCLCRLRSDVGKDLSFALPYKIGCVRGGAHWPVIQKMIEEVLKDYNVTFYCINPNEIDEEDKEKFENA